MPLRFGSAQWPFHHYEGNVSRIPVCVLLTGFVLSCGTVQGQNYPNKPVRILTAEAGGGGDVFARLLAQGMSAGLAQQFIVDNRPGTLSIEMAARSAPDGYTLLFHASAIWLMPFMRNSVAWDPIRDFAPISIPDSAFNIVVAHPSLTVKTVRDLIALAKARPGELNYGASSGGATHLAAEMFKQMAGVNIVRIPYRGNGPALNDLIGGQIHLMFPVAAAVLPHIKTHRVRALAITSARGSDLVPDLPTVAATVPGYESVSIHAMMAPAGTPAAIINRLNQEIIRVINLPDVREKFLKATTEVVGSTPEQLAAVIKLEMARMGKVIKDAGIRED